MTKFVKKADIQSKWFEIDATDAVVGRIATVVSKIIRGKNKTTFTPHMDHGDFVVVKNVDLIKEIEGYQTYFLPKNLLGIIWRGKYKGQKQKWFCMRFKGDDTEINIKTKKPEFSEWRWIDLNEITKWVVDFKTDVYKNLKTEVKKIIFN